MHADAPWWVAYPVPDTPPLPWSGEVVPIDVPPVPVDVPVAGPVLHFIGQGEHAVWNDVFNWVKGGARAASTAITSVETTIANAVVQTVESYIGSLLQATSSFVNDAFNYTQLIGDSLGAAVIGTWDMAQAGIMFLSAYANAILADVTAIDTIVIPGLEAEIGRLGIDIWNVAAGVIDGVESWAIDNIYDPLVGDIEREIAHVRADVWTIAGTITDDLTAKINAEALRRAAAIAGIAAAVAAITAWVDDCGEPMCQTLGPKTDLGKLLKGLKVATELAALTALLDMNESDLANLITALTSHLANVVGDFEQFFAPGGETVAGLVKAVTAEAL